MKKILLYTDTPQIGGAEVQILLLAKFLDKRKFEPIIACSAYHELDNWCEKLHRENVRTIRLKVRHKHDPSHFSLLKRIIKDEQIDLLHAQIWNPAACRYAFFAANSTKTPIITTEHDPFKLGIFKNAFKKITLNKIAKIVTISQNNRKIFTDLYPKHKQKIEMIHNGIDLIWWHSQLIRFDKKDIENTKINIFHAHADTLIITTIAELHERKGLTYLINALQEVVKEYPNVKLVIIGEGKEHSNLTKLVNQLKLTRHVIFMGRQSAIPHMLKSSDIFVLPSRREAFGLVNVEAMLAELPVIATKVGGIPEIVEDEKTGILVKPEDSKSLTKALLVLIEHPNIRKKLAEAGKKRAEEYFDAKKMAEQYEKVYESILK